MLSGLNHLTLAVSSLAPSVAFYHQLLGMTLHARWDGGAYLSCGDLWLCLSLDPQHLSRHDRYENGEYRWQTIGLVHGVIVVLVAHSIRFESGTEVIRIISARKADKNYEHG